MIRKAVFTDLDSIAEGYHEHFLHEKKYGACTVFQEGIYPTRADAERALKSGTLYVYEENGAIMGSIIFDKRQPDEKVNVIHLLMVRPCASGKGIGSALINYVAESAKQQSCTVIRLDTGEQNIPASSLYKKLGFRLAAILPMKVGGIISHKRHLFFEKMLQ